MVLDWVIDSFDHSTSSAILRRFIDMPETRPGKMCMIRKVHVSIEDLSNIRTYDISFAMSADPDAAVPALMWRANSSFFLMGRLATHTASGIGFQIMEFSPLIFEFAEGIKCPYSRLPFFIEHSNANTAVTTYRITVFYEFISVNAKELAVAVLRRGRGVTRD